MWWVGVGQHRGKSECVAGSWSTVESMGRAFQVEGSTVVEWYGGGEECHVCEHLEQRAMLGTSFSIMRGGHSAVSWEQSMLCVGDGVWMEPRNLPDGVGGGALTTVHQPWPRGPRHSILEWECGDPGPIRKKSANMSPAGNKAEISWHWTACSYLV